MSPKDNRAPCALPVKPDAIYGCWLWGGRTDKDGYPRIEGGLAHRAVYAQQVGEVPEGMELDHRCRRRACVRPGHLEPVKRSDNERRKSWAYRVRQALPCGCDGFSAIRTPEGGRLCREHDV